MAWKVFMAAFAVLGLSHAQTPEGFTPSVEGRLDVHFNKTLVDPPGLLLTKAETSKAPTISLPNIQPDTYIFMMIDLDVPASFTNPNSGPRRTNLHAMTQDWVADGQGLVTSAAGPVPYVGPAPPAETPPHPHRYVTLLFRQPKGFVIPESQKAKVQQKIGFDIVSFIKDAGLEAPILANWFTVSG